MAGGKAKSAARAPRLWVLILAAQRESQRMLSEALRPLGITPAQGEVLSVLSSHPPLTLNALGERLVCETGSPSRLVSGVVRRGWVGRAAAAGRGAPGVLAGGGGGRDGRRNGGRREGGGAGRTTGRRHQQRYQGQEG